MPLEGHLQNRRLRNDRPSPGILTTAKTIHLTNSMMVYESDQVPASCISSPKRLHGSSRWYGAHWADLVWAMAFRRTPRCYRGSIIFCWTTIHTYRVVRCFVSRGYDFPNMIDELLDGGWVRCPDCGSEAVGWSDDEVNMWVSRIECEECGNSVSEMTGHG